MTFLPIDVKAQVESAAAILAGLTDLTDDPQVRGYANRLVGLLVRIEPESARDTLIAVALDAFDLQGYLRCHNHHCYADMVRGAGYIVRAAIDKLSGLSNYFAADGPNDINTIRDRMEDDGLNDNEIEQRLGDNCRRSGL